MFGGRFTSSVGPVGVDVGSRCIKLLQVREQSGRLNLLGAAHVDRCPANEGESEQQRAAHLAEQLHAAWTNGGFTGRRCVVSLPRRDVNMQSIRLPRMPESELRQAAGWEAAQRFSIDRESMEFDFVRTGATLQSGESREEVLLIAASHALLQSHLDPVLAAGLRPVAVDADFAALARAYSRQFRRETDESMVRAVVEIGYSGSSILILRGDQIAFAKALSLGGRELNAAVAEHLQMDGAAAEELRASRIMSTFTSKANDAPDPATDRAVFEAARPLLGELVREVVLCLRYYGVTFRGHPPERIILSGGDGLEPRLNTMLAEACKMPVVFDDQPGTLQGLVRQISMTFNTTTSPAPCWAVAAGLSLRGLGAARRLSEAKLEKGRRGAA